MKLNRGVVLIPIILSVLIIIAVVVYLSQIDKNSTENMYGDSIKYDETLKDILPTTPESRGDIPTFVNLLREARDKSDLQICNTLPEPQDQVFSFGDHTHNAPNHDQWKTYCIALASKDTSLCSTINRFSHPNLQAECQWAMEKFLFSDSDYKYCYEQFGKLFTSAGEVSNCLLKFDLSQSPKLYQKLFECLRNYSDEPKDKIGSIQDECLYGIALEFNEKKLCEVIDLEYSAYKFNTPNCIMQLNTQ